MARPSHNHGLAIKCGSPFIRRLLLAGLVCLWLSLALTSVFGQGNAGTIRGTVVDPSDAVVKGATVEIQNPVSHYTRSVQTDDQGAFEFDNTPFNPYHLTVNATGFQAETQDVDV
ncbi:MAG TPA: carboxypeptidase-like regulatory domain-containing protein, partial [Blastocatellia bacterium]|nr:carboxypeptidase-like regulatory domain-containing protein [Blastocatellia bacterium]